MRVWAGAMKRAIVRHVERTGSPIFTRQALLAAEGAALVEETRTSGKTPYQTATRDLHLLRRDGFIETVDRGTYRWLGAVPPSDPDTPSSAVFALSARADRTVLPEQGYVFASDWLRTARRAAGQWVIYQGSGGYGAAAFVDRVVAEENRSGLSRAQIEPGSYLEFGRVVPLELEGLIFEEGLAAQMASWIVRRRRKPFGRSRRKTSIVSLISASSPTTNCCRAMSRKIR